MGEMLKVALERSIRKNIPEGQVDEDSDVEVLNRPPTTSLKFMAVPRYNEATSLLDSAPPSSLVTFDPPPLLPLYLQRSSGVDPPCNLLCPLGSVLGGAQRRWGANALPALFCLI